MSDLLVRKKINLKLIFSLFHMKNINLKLIFSLFNIKKINLKLIFSLFHMKNINPEFISSRRKLGASLPLVTLPPMTRPAQDSPWQALFKLAVKQEGLFSARQAASVGCSQQLLAKYVANGRVERVQRALYRITDFPAGEHEGLVAVWLWSRNEGVFSHETGLFLHDLSDALPVRAHITLPSTWRTRAIHPSEGTAAYYADIPDSERVWVGPVPVTSVRRTLSDCLHASVAPELIAQASMHAAERGLISAEEVLQAPLVGLWRLRAQS